MAAGGKPERGSVALPADLPEKAWQYVAAEEPHDSDRDPDGSSAGDEAELSEWAEAAAMIEADGGDASGIRYLAKKWG